MQGPGAGCRAGPVPAAFATAGRLGLPLVAVGGRGGALNMYMSRRSKHDSLFVVPDRIKSVLHSCTQYKMYEEKSWYI